MLTIIEHMYNFHVKGGGLHFGIPDYQTCFQNVIKIYVREGLKKYKKILHFWSVLCRYYKRITNQKITQLATTWRYVCSQYMAITY